ncbi:hypothetical protein ALC53_06838 [Atta colombica]|uniref:Uncharacterized protein n=1 Tax=Atta colombica TaxID=520822 RepID=A0A195BDM8_9HYME|nr:hypothetical protein ALC53_06838 [Atta colombica]
MENASQRRGLSPSGHVQANLLLAANLVIAADLLIVRPVTIVLVTIVTGLYLFQLIQFQKPQPAIHLDNRYRLMRHEPMLDADGNVTDVIGEV